MSFIYMWAVSVWQVCLASSSAVRWRRPSRWISFWEIPPRMCRMSFTWASTVQDRERREGRSEGGPGGGLRGPAGGRHGLSLCWFWHRRVKGEKSWLCPAAATALSWATDSKKAADFHFSSRWQELFKFLPLWYCRRGFICLIKTVSYSLTLLLSANIRTRKGKDNCSLNYTHIQLLQSNWIKRKCMREMIG